MPVVSLPWLDNGAEIELRSVPLAGSQELQDSIMRGARAEAARNNLSSVMMMQYVNAARMVRTKKGSEPAREMWNATMKQNGLQPLVWSEEDFDASLDAWIDARLKQPLEITEDEDIEEALRAKTAEVNAEYQKHEAEILRNQGDAALIELYWRIHASTARHITPPDDPPIPFKRGQDHQEEMREAMVRCASLEDLAEIRQALKPKRDAPIDDATFQLTDAEAVRGKSEPTSEPSTKLSGDSPASSEPTTVDATK